MAPFIRALASKDTAKGLERTPDLENHGYPEFPDWLTVADAGVTAGSITGPERAVCVV